MPRETGPTPTSIRIEGYSPIQSQRLFQLHRAWMVYNTISDRLNNHPDERRALGYEASDGGKAYHPINRQFHFGVWTALWGSPTKENGQRDGGLVQACVDMGLRDEVEDILMHYGKGVKDT